MSKKRKNKRFRAAQSGKEVSGAVLTEEVSAKTAEEVSKKSTDKKEAPVETEEDSTNSKEGTVEIEEVSTDSKDEVSAETKELKHTGRAFQVVIYFGKLFRMFFFESDWKVLPMSAVIAGLVAFAVGANLFKTMEGTLLGSFAVSCICIWNGFFNSIQSVCRERAIIKREHRCGLHISSYIAAHMLYQALLCAAQVVITIQVLRMTNVTFPTVSLLTGKPLVDIGITLFLSIYCADMLAILVSSISRTTTAAMTIMPFLLIVQLVFAGALFTLPQQARFLTDFTISKWSLTALCVQADYNDLPMVTVWNTAVSMKNLEIEGKKPLQEALVYIEQNGMKQDILKACGEQSQKPDYEFSLEKLLNCWLGLILQTVAYAGLSVVSLESIDKDKR